MKKVHFFLILSLIGIRSSSQQVNAINEFMQYCQTNFRFNGVVLIADSNKILYEHAFGKANKENGVSNQIDTKFRLGSISKQFTAFIILQLIERGDLSFNDHLAQYISAFDSPDKRSITIRNLLTHTSGLADYTSLKYFNGQVYYSKDSITKMIAAAPLSFSPSSTYSYSNSNFFLLATIIEKLTGKSFSAVLNELVLIRLGMLNSGEEEGAIIKNEAKSYLYRNDSTFAAPFIEMKNTAGGGGMFSTAEDLFKWSLFFQRLLAEDTLIKEALQAFTLTDGTKTIYSCGWCLMPNVLFHTGHINGFANLIAIDTLHHLTVVLLTNDDYFQLYITMQSIINILQDNGALNVWIANKPLKNLPDYRGVYTIQSFKVNIKDTLNYLEGDAFGQRQFLRWYNKDEFFFLNLEGMVKFERNHQGVVISLKSFQDYYWYSLKKE